MVMRESYREGPQRSANAAYEVLKQNRRELVELWDRVYFQPVEELRTQMGEMLRDTFDSWSSDPTFPPLGMEIGEISLVHAYLQTNGRAIEESKSTGLLVKVTSPVEQHVLLSADLAMGVVPVEVEEGPAVWRLVLPQVDKQGKIQRQLEVKLTKEQDHDGRQGDDVVSHTAFLGEVDVTPKHGFSGFVKLLAESIPLYPVPKAARLMEALDDPLTVSPEYLERSLGFLKKAKALARIAEEHPAYFPGLVGEATATVSQLRDRLSSSVDTFDLSNVEYR